MKYTMKGNFFKGQYHEADAGSGKVVSKASDDLDNHLWDCRVSNEHLDEVLDSTREGSMFGGSFLLKNALPILRNTKKRC